MSRTITNVTYKMNILGIVFMIAALAVFAGAVGGSQFERGVAGLLVYDASEVFNFTVESRSGWIRNATLLLIPVGIGIYIWGLSLVIMGLS